MKMRTDTDPLNDAVGWNNSIAWLSAAMFSSASGIGALDRLPNQMPHVSVFGFVGGLDTVVSDKYQSLIKLLLTTVFTCHTNGEDHLHVQVQQR